MFAELDFNKSSLVIELLEKGKGFQLLLYYWIDFKNERGNYLVHGITDYLDFNLTEQYGHLFMPLKYYKSLKTSP